MRIVSTFEEARAVIAAPAALVPTMGALHAGHLSLVEVASETGAAVVMSVFVNPLQFDDPSDLERYPRDLDRDSSLAEGAGVSVLFTPTADEMYPAESSVTVGVGRLAEAMEGEHRPGHFAGVATVVVKLFAGLRPELAVFGRKDAQQLAVVRRLTRDLSFPVRVVGAPTVREPDGLAMSSRNVFIPAGGRSAARGLSAGLFAAADAVVAGERDARALEAIAANGIGEAGAGLEYSVLADAVEAAPIEHLDRPAFLAVAATVGEVRLIDNVFLWPDGTVDRGVIADEGSV